MLESEQEDAENNLTYQGLTRPQLLNSHSLERRRVRGALTEVFKSVKDFDREMSIKN